MTSDDHVRNEPARLVPPLLGGSPPVLDRTLTLVMAAATGLAIANIYYNQPLVGLVAHDFAGDGRAALLPTVTLIGYAIGIVLLVPLSDRMDRRSLILAQTAGLTAALVIAAVAPTATGLLAASTLVGFFASIAQQIVPFAAALADPARRGRAVGAVMSGLLVGILLARTGSGLIGQWLGWRAVFWVGAGLALAMGIVLAFRLPHSRPTTREAYPRLLASLVGLLAREPGLRLAAVTQGLLFAGFSAFWTTLSLLLEQPRFGLGSAAAGLFGVLAVGGVLIAPVAGRFADENGPHGVVRAGAALVLTAFLLMTFHVGLAALAVGVVVMDAGVQMAMISNQAIIYALAGEARGRFNTVFIAVMFAFGSVGSAAAGLAWSAGGWTGVMLLAAAFASIALILQVRGRRTVSTRKGQLS